MGANNQSLRILARAFQHLKIISQNLIFAIAVFHNGTLCQLGNFKIIRISRHVGSGHKKTPIQRLTFEGCTQQESNLQPSDS